MKRPTRGERHQACARKRRYRSQGDALDAASLADCARRARQLAKLNKQTTREMAVASGLPLRTVQRLVNGK